MSVYFRTEICRLTFAELWRISSTLKGFLAGCTIKILGLRRPPRWAIRHDNTIRVLPADQLPEAVLQAMGPLIDEFEQAGARLAFYSKLDTTDNLSGYSAVLLPAEHNAVVVVSWAQAHFSRPRQPQFGCVVASQLQDGTFLSTSNHRRRFNTAPGFQVHRLVGANPAELAHRHQQALGECGLSPALVRDAEQAKKLLVEAKVRQFEWQVSRGVWVPLSTAELARLGLGDSEAL
jgi:hypothetical protein